MHVDKTPQAKVTVPCLTRCWSDVSKCDEHIIPFVESSQRIKFVLLQEVCRVHLLGLVGTSWSSLSLEIVKLMSLLFQFNFYGTRERLADTLPPLLKALDRCGSTPRTALL